VTVFGSGGVFSDVIEISAGHYHNCALRQDETIHCWGQSGSGQVGNLIGSQNPIQIAGIENATSISSSERGNCALIRDGSIACWGPAASLGDNSPVDETTPTRISTTPVKVFGISTAIAISKGSGHTCALLSSSKVECWGGNSTGQIGDGSKTFRYTAVEVAETVSYPQLFVNANHVGKYLVARITATDSIASTSRFTRSTQAVQP
jgi:alpha-tubulin suppressor-like RCC1 family protein